MALFVDIFQRGTNAFDGITGADALNVTRHLPSGTANLCKKKVGADMACSQKAMVGDKSCSCYVFEEP